MKLTNILERYDVRFPSMGDCIIAAHNEDEAIDIAMKRLKLPESYKEHARIVYHAALD